MSLIVDTSGILAAVNKDDAAHESVREAIEAERGALVVLDLVVAEADYLLLHHVSRQAEEAFLDDLSSGAWARETLRDEDLTRAVEVVRRYREHDVGIVDAAVVAVAERLRVERVLTLDRRHFGMFRLWDRKPVVIVPSAA